MRHYADLVRYFGMKILIAGAGSIGQRHARNLQAIGMKDIAVSDPDASKLSTLATELSCTVYEDFIEALETVKPDAVFVCSPTKFHVNQALAAAKTGAQLFVEKPLNHTMEGVDALKKEVDARSLICMVGCNMRFHHGPSTVKKLLDSGVIGTVRDAEVRVLFDFTGRADIKGNLKRIRATYNADPAQGGAIRECVHEIDLALWYFGPGALKRASKIPARRIGIPEVEGEASLRIRHESGVDCHVHLSFMHPEYKRGCDIRGSKGSIRWDFTENIVHVTGTDGHLEALYPAPQSYAMNQMYLDEILHFFACIKSGVQPMGNLHEASEALAMALKGVKTAKEMEESSVPAC